MAAALHPTYLDRLVLQGRANALLYSKDAYWWLKFRLPISIIPRTRFIDIECNRLAAIFCKSIYKILKDSESRDAEKVLEEHAEADTEHDKEHDLPPWHPSLPDEVPVSTQAAQPARTGWGVGVGGRRSARLHGTRPLTCVCRRTTW